MNSPQSPLPFRPAIWLLLAALLQGSFTVTAAASGDATVWTRADGVSIHARFVGWDGRRIFLVRHGRHFEVPLDQLSSASVEKARRLLDPAKGASADNGGRRIRTPLPHPRAAAPQAPQPAVIDPRGLRKDRHGMPFHPSTVLTRVVRTTAYSCGESDHLVYGNLSAYGTPLRYTEQLRSAAADWSVYPLGTRFRIKGLPWLYVVDDYGSALVGTGTIDLYHPTLEGMRSWGRRNVEVTIVRWGCRATSERILQSRQRHDHCRRMLEAIRGTPAHSAVLDSQRRMR